VLASRPGFSQRATSFIASQCQGIHQMPLLRLILNFQPFCATRRDKPRHVTANLLEDTIPVKAHEAWSNRSPAPPKPTTSYRSSVHTYPQYQTADDLDDRTYVFGLPQSRTDALSLMIAARTNLLVEVNGIEPMTSCLQSRRSTN
jgi:hypothetical protein